MTVKMLPSTRTAADIFGSMRKNMGEPPPEGDGDMVPNGRLTSKSRGDKCVSPGYTDWVPWNQRRVNGWVALGLLVQAVARWAGKLFRKG